ncbi:HNH endonuclease [bacterium]|nr:HNH endonuclease [bacterium]
MAFKKGHKVRKGMGRTKGSFKKGQKPWNKGLTKNKDKRLDYKRPTKFKRGIHPKTQFKKGFKHTEEWKKNQGEKMKGNKHPNWKGGISSINRRLRSSKEYALWREAVFKRDNWTCIFCGQRGERLNADHIKPFALFPELRFAIDNGRTLCEDCHRKIGWNKFKEDNPKKKK